MNGEVVGRARACLGIPFRMQGRDPSSGLDCIGLAAFACGIEPPPARYALRGGVLRDMLATIDASGLVRVPAAEPGDVVMLQAGVQQFHLGVLVPGGLVHADGRLGRVVERSGPLPWPVIAAWRVDEGGAAWQRSS